MPTFPIPIAFHSQAIGFGGGERQLATLALALDPAKWKVHVIFQHPGGPWQSRFESAGIAMRQLRLTSYFGPAALREAFALRQYFSRHGVRICHGFDFTANVFVTPVARSVRNVVALSTQRCQTQLIPSKYQLLTRLAHRVAHGVVVNSDLVGSEIMTELKLPAKRVEVLPNAINTEVFSPNPRTSLPGLPTGDIVIGTISVLRPEKNVSTLLKAFATILPRYPSTTLLVVGDGTESIPLQQLALQLGIADKTVFLPATSEVARHLRSIDIFVLPSTSESLSNSLMEAMACGCAPVASDLDGNLELLSGLKNQSTFPAMDSAVLAENLCRLLDSPSLRSEMGRDAAVQIQSRYSIPSVVKRLENLYFRLLGENQIA